MNLESARKNIIYAWALSSIGIVLDLGLTFNIPILADLLKTFSIYLFLPWLFPSGQWIIYFVIVSALTFLLYRKSRIAAILLFGVFLFERAFTFIWLYIFSTLFIIIWICVTLIWAFIFFQGIRGTFVYHKMADKTKLESE